MPPPAPITQQRNKENSETTTHRQMMVRNKQKQTYKTKQNRLKPKQRKKTSNKGWPCGEIGWVPSNPVQHRSV